MEVIIKQNSTQTLIVDPRLYGDSGVNWDEVLENAVVTFSLFDVETGCFVIANRPGDIIPGGLSANDEALVNSVACGDNTSVTRIAYKFRTRDVKQTGVFKATFQVNVIGEETVLAVPATSDIQVIVTQSAISPWTSATYTGLPELSGETTVPPVTGITGNQYAGTWAELNVLLGNAQLVPGFSYLLTDYQTVHRVPTQTAIHSGSTEPLVLVAVTATAFARVVQSTVNPADILHYEFSNSSVKCEDSFDSTSAAGAACQNNGSVFRPGYIVYREDPVKKLATHYDFRAFRNRVGTVERLTFDDNSRNVEIGEYSGNIIVDNAANVTIGENSQGLHLHKIAKRIVIGNDVVDFSTLGTSVHPQAASYFELSDYGLGGNIRSTLRFLGGVSFEGTTLIGFLPANCAVTGLEVINQGFPKLGTVSLGIAGLAADELFAATDVADIFSGVYSAQVSTRTLATNSSLLLTLGNSAYGQGVAHIHTTFANTSALNALVTTGDTSGGNTGGGGDIVVGTGITLLEATHNVLGDSLYLSLDLANGDDYFVLLDGDAVGSFRAGPGVVQTYVTGIQSAAIPVNGKSQLTLLSGNGTANLGPVSFDIYSTPFGFIDDAYQYGDGYRIIYLQPFDGDYSVVVNDTFFPISKGDAYQTCYLSAAQMCAASLANNGQAVISIKDTNFGNQISNQTVLTIPAPSQPVISIVSDEMNGATVQLQFTSQALTVWSLYVNGNFVSGNNVTRSEKPVDYLLRYQDSATVTVKLDFADSTQVFTYPPTSE